ncbi:MAG: hypothetical protein GQ526_01280 [Ardenticatenales bacterium]|nr:hypothetical protein [Ardenticatenales bacterium]
MTEELERAFEKDPLAIPEMRAIIDRVIEESKHVPGALMVVLNELQGKVGYVSFPMQDYVAQRLRVPLSQIYGVVSF